MKRLARLLIAVALTVMGLSDLVSRIAVPAAAALYPHLEAARGNAQWSLGSAGQRNLLDPVPRRLPRPAVLPLLPVVPWALLSRGGCGWPMALTVTLAGLRSAEVKTAGERFGGAIGLGVRTTTRAARTGWRRPSQPSRDTHD